MKIEKIYNIILLKSRNYKLYNDFKVKDLLDNKIILFLIHFSFIFNRLNKSDEKNSQKLFDYIFSKIEIDLRELGYGDMTVNKKMKIIINKFYSILVDFRDFNNISFKNKAKLVKNLLNPFNDNSLDFHAITNYFDNFGKLIDLISINDIHDANLIDYGSS